MDLIKMKIFDENMEKLIENLKINFSEEDIEQMYKLLTDNEIDLLNEMEQKLNMEHLDLKTLKDQVGEGAILKMLMQLQNNPVLRQKVQDIVMKKLRE